MTSNNSTLIPPCPKGREWYLDAGHNTELIANYILHPLFNLLGTVLHAICLKTFFREAKKEKAFQYQVFLTVGRTVKAAWLLLYTFAAFWLAFSTSPRTAWFRSCYVCMWSTVRIGYVVQFTTITLTILLSTLVSCERFYALWKPISFKLSYKNRNNRLILFILVSLACIVNAGQGLRYNVISSPVSGQSSVYLIVQNPLFISSLFGDIVLQSRAVVEFMALGVMCFCNAGIIWLFRKRRLERKKTLGIGNAAQKRQEIENTLCLLGVSQSICYIIGITWRGVYLIFVSIDPAIATCQGVFVAPLGKLVTGGVDLLDFAFVFAINNQFRKAVLRTAGCGGGDKVQSVQITPLGRM